MRASTGVDVKELLGDEYEPQTALERLSKHFEVEIDGDGDDAKLHVTLDNDDAEKLLEAVLANEGAFYDRQA